MAVGLEIGVRAYLGAVNPKRYTDVGPVPPGSALPIVADALGPEPAGGRKLLGVGESHDDDDLAMSQYRPHVRGAPVHLMTACINQTFDSRGRFNRDRRGLPLTIAPEGWFGVDRSRGARRRAATR